MTGRKEGERRLSGDVACVAVGISMQVLHHTDCRRTAVMPYAIAAAWLSWLVWGSKGPEPQAIE